MCTDDNSTGEGKRARNLVTIGEVSKSNAVRSGFTPSWKRKRKKSKKGGKAPCNCNACQEKTFGKRKQEKKKLSSAEKRNKGRREGHPLEALNEIKASPPSFPKGKAPS